MAQRQPSGRGGGAKEFVERCLRVGLTCLGVVAQQYCRRSLSQRVMNGNGVLGSLWPGLTLLLADVQWGFKRYGECQL